MCIRDRDNIVVRKAVTTGMASKEEMEIKSGLSEGEKVITTIDATIIEGMQVTESTEQDTDCLLSTSRCV